MTCPRCNGDCGSANPPVMNCPMIRPPMPDGEDLVWYRGWQAGWDRTADFWTSEGYYACKGGVDLDAQTVTAKTWTGLLDAIDEEENV